MEQAPPHPIPPSGLSRLACAAVLHDMPLPVEGKCGLLLSVYTSTNIQQIPYNRTRVGALKFLDAPDRSDLIQRLLNRIKHAKGRMSENYGFDVRSCTFVLECEFIWIILIGINALSYGKWYKVFQRVAALDVKVACVHRSRGTGTHSSLETAADMFNALTTIDQLSENEIWCDVDEEGMAVVRAKKRRQPAASSSRKKAARASCERPAGDQGGLSISALIQEIDVGSDDLVNDCLAFLTSKEMPSVQPLHAKIMDLVSHTPQFSQIGLYLLSQRPLELFGRVVHLRMAVIRVLRAVYGVDARKSLCTKAVAHAYGYRLIPPKSQAALRMISQCMDHERDHPILSLLDMVRVWIPFPCSPCSAHVCSHIQGVIITLVSMYILDQKLQEGEGCKDVQFLDNFKHEVAEVCFGSGHFVSPS